MEVYFITPEEFQKKRQILFDRIDFLKEEIATMECMVDSSFPEKVRPATVEDIKVGAVIWCKHFADEKMGWNIVKNVHALSDSWEAYIAEDGWRYGINGAFVRVK